MIHLYLIAAFVSGILARHFIRLAWIPLSADARVIRAQVIAHLDSVADKSEIMLRHDAQALRNKL
jgi:hypothetical protein